LSYSDPQSIKVGTAAAISLPRVSTGTNTSTYKSGDGFVELVPAHAIGAKRIRRSDRLNYSKVAPDPLTAVNTNFGMTVNLVVDIPKIGFTQAEQLAIVKAHIARFTDEQITKLLGGEN